MVNIGKCDLDCCMLSTDSEILKNVSIGQPEIIQHGPSVPPAGMTQCNTSAVHMSPTAPANTNNSHQCISTPRPLHCTAGHSHYSQFQFHFSHYVKSFEGDRLPFHKSADMYHWARLLMLQLLAWTGHDYPWEGVCLPTYRLLIECAIAKSETEPLRAYKLNLQPSLHWRQGGAMCTQNADFHSTRAANRCNHPIIDDVLDLDLRNSKLTILTVMVSIQSPMPCKSKPKTENENPKSVQKPRICDQEI